MAIARPEASSKCVGMPELMMKWGGSPRARRWLGSGQAGLGVEGLEGGEVLVHQAGGGRTRSFGSPVLPTSASTSRR